MIDIFTPWVSLAQMTKLVSEFIIGRKQSMVLGSAR